MASNELLLVDMIGEVVDKMRATGAITLSVEVSPGVYTITSINELANNESVSINDVDYLVTNTTATTFDIEAVTGLDFTGDSWKALAPYYDHGHPIDITNKLLELNSGNYQYRKYPLIVLLQEFDEVKDIDKDGLYSVASPDIVIINLTGKNIHVEDRYDLNFRTVLYPLYNSFLKQMSKCKYFLTKGNAVFSHTVREAPYYGTEGSGGNTANGFTDMLDGLKINSTSIKVNDNRCNFLNK